jgi:uncharacterized protein YktB (UPF0637 family)
MGGNNFTIQGLEAKMGEINPFLRGILAFFGNIWQQKKICTNRQ